MNHENSGRHYLHCACQVSDVVSRTIKRQGQTSLLNYVKNLMAQNPSPFQSRQDLLDIVAAQVRPLLGKSIASVIVRDLEAHPFILTANHHGVDFFAQSVQGSLIFSLPRFETGNSASTIPVFSFGNIPLNNLTYPRGVLLYNINGYNLDKMPIKLPIFSNRQKRDMVSAASAMDQGMVKRAQTRFDALVREEKICPTLNNSIRVLFNDTYAAPEVLQQPSYSLQATKLNHSVWRRLFQSGTKYPEMVYLEIEKIVTDLLIKDLHNPESLAHIVMFEPSIRKRILSKLDGDRACWDTKMLDQRLKADQKKLRSLHGGGTHLFWGIDSRRRRIPLSLIHHNGGKAVLSGIDDSGKKLEVPFEVERIVEALQRQQLLPSLFTCFLVTAFARGMVCAGGYFQAAYLPIMQRAVREALEEQNGYGDVAQVLSNTVSDTYLSGMQAVMKKIRTNHLVPAGPVEIMASGGLSGADVEKIMDLTVEDAHLGALFETVPDLLPRDSQPRGWKEQLAMDCHQLLHDRVVVK